MDKSWMVWSKEMLTDIFIALGVTGAVVYGESLLKTC